MRRLHTFCFALATTATLTAPATAHAQLTERAVTQLFMAPTGRAVPKGQGYFKAVGLSVPYAQGGVTDRFSVGLGMPIFTLGRAVVISPKLQVQRSENHSTAVGAIEFVSAFGSGGVAYVTHTTELQTGALHIAVFTPTIGHATGRAALFMIGAEHRVNDRVTFITENYVSPHGCWPILTGGVRIKGPHTTWDLGWLAPVGAPYATMGTPIVSAGWKF